MRPLEVSKRDLVRQWVRKAEKDFALAEHLVLEGCLYGEAIGFNSQQAAEKFLKALLVLYQVGFPKTHNLGELLDLVSTVEPVLAGDLRGVTALNPYGIEYRYPGDFPELTEEDSRSAFGLAEKVREAVMPVAERRREFRNAQAGLGAQRVPVEFTMVRHDHLSKRGVTP